MLSVEHVRARKDRERLVLTKLTEPKRRRAAEIAERLIDELSRRQGASRDEVEEAFARIEIAPTERRLADGLAKLLLDGAEFEPLAGVEPAELRSELFLRASEARRNATPSSPYEPERVFAAVAEGRGMSEELLREALYADLRGAHRLVHIPTIDAVSLVLRYEQAQVQAVLLRAVEVVARVRCRTPDVYRMLFQKLKFRQLLYRLEPLPDGGYSITIDGPYSMFEAVTKYGLELAMTLPVLEACDVLELTAKVLWGKSRAPLIFEHHHVSPRATAGPAWGLRDDVQNLMDDFGSIRTPWRVEIAQEIIDLPGIGSCVPDLCFHHRDGGAPIHVEVLGYWSRDAVFRRVDLVERGIARGVVFAASTRLRVSEALLDGDEPAALYVYRGKPSARALERKLDAVRARLGHDV